MRPIVSPTQVPLGDDGQPLSRRERGANIVEFAIMAPLIALLLMGLLEMGLAWRDSLTVATAARSGARVGSNLGNQRLADYETIQSVLAAMSAIDDDKLEMIIIYDGSATDGAIPAACLASGGTSVANVCNAYDNTALATLDATDFEADPLDPELCKAGSLDEAWCPKDRTYSSQHTLGFFGVYVRAKYESITKILPTGDLTLEDTTVMRVEPRLETAP